MEPLIHCIYTSMATSWFSAERLFALTQQAQALNQRDGITGMLLHYDRSFFQVLEGPADKVDRCFVRIQRDSRHIGVSRLISEPIAQRSFPSWTMGLVHLSPQALREIDGFGDAFGEHPWLDTIDLGCAKRLLSAFAGGRAFLQTSGTRVDMSVRDDRSQA